MGWLISYGDRAWPAALVLFVLAGLVIARLGTWRRARRAAGRARANLGPSVGSPLTDGLVAVWEGRIEAKQGPCRRFEDGKPCAAASVTFIGVRGKPPRGGPITARAGRLALVADGQTLALDGEVLVVVGSTETWWRRPFGTLSRAVRGRVVDASELIDDAAFVDEAVLRSVCDGERVAARGRLRATGGEGRGGYREAAVAWQLVGETEGGPVPIACNTPRVRGPASSRLVPFGGGAAAVFFSLAAALGAFAVRQGSAISEPGEPGHGVAVLQEHLPLLAVASATPFHRREAVALLEHAVGEADGPSPRVTLVAEALSRIEGHCGRSIMSLLDVGADEQAAEIARRCPDGRSILLRALWDEENPQRASRVLALADPTNSQWEAELHMLAGHHERAVRPLLGRGHEATCIGLAMQARAGDRAAKRDLERRASAGGHRLTCSLLLADLLEGEARLQVLDTLAPPRTISERYAGLVDWVAILLAVEADPTRVPRGLSPAIAANPVALVCDSSNTLRGVQGLERAVLRKLVEMPSVEPATRSLRVRLASAAAAFDSVAGKHDSALRWARLAAEDAERLRPEEPVSTCGARIAIDEAFGLWAFAADEAAGLWAAVELRAGSRQAARERIERIPPQRWFVDQLSRAAARSVLPGLCDPEAAADFGRPPNLEQEFLSSLASRPERQLTKASDLLRLGPMPALAARIAARRDLVARTLLERSTAVPLSLLRVGQVDR